ncbi:MAG: hypothetical protein WC370_06375 [Dehalococcoidales bacterium]|jgi:hypothetical protein
MRVLAVIVIILGLAAIVLGIMFIPQASSGQKDIEVSIAPLKINEVDEKYDAVSAKYDVLKAAEEPGIQGQTAAPSINYVYVSAQRALLGLAKANIGTVKAIRIMGIADIIIGAGLVLGGFVMLRKSA